jgi:large subunit ribosomal protein L17
MRHRVKGRKLSRTASHRLATLRALATALFREKKIRTTVAKAKELRRFAEPLISKAKNDTVANRRHVARFIQDKEVLKELFTEIVSKIGERPGGYTRVVKLGQRLGDGAEMAIIELVDYNDVSEKPKAKKSAPKKEEVIEEANVVEETAEEVKEEVVEETKEEKSDETTDEKNKEVTKSDEEKSEETKEEDIASSEEDKKEEK